MIAGRFAAAGSRLLQAIVTVLGASVLIWAVLPLSPGDPAERVLKARGVEEPTPAQVAAVHHEFGLDRPLLAQYGNWLAGMARGDLSTSFVSSKPVTVELRERLPATLVLAGAALALSIAVAVPSAMVAATYWQRLPDSVIRSATLLCTALPPFLLGLIMLELVVVRAGIGSALSDGSVSQVLMPAICLSLSTAPLWSRLLRSSLLEQLSLPYALVASARGASARRVLLRHAFPNASIPFISAVGIGTAGLLGGAPVVETVFNWPGIGSYVVRSIGARDLPVVQAFATIATLVYVGSSLITDAAVALIDPRTQPGEQA